MTCPQLLSSGPKVPSWVTSLASPTTSSHLLTISIHHPSSQAIWVQVWGSLEQGRARVLAPAVEAAHSWLVEVAGEAGACLFFLLGLPVAETSVM